jgi:hypothetical protein
LTTESSPTGQALPKSAPSVGREDDALYQGNPPQRVARVFEPVVNWEAREIRFREIYQSDYLLLPDECEFQKYRIMIQRVEFATRVEKGAPEKGRVLREVVAEILGYREQ